MSDLMDNVANNTGSEGWSSGIGIYRVRGPGYLRRIDIPPGLQESASP